MSKTLFALAILASALSIPLTAHADTVDQFTFSFVTPPGYLSANLVIDLPASPPPSPCTLQGICFTDCFDVVGTSGGRSYIVDFLQFTPGGGTTVDFALFNPMLGPPNQPNAYTEIFTPSSLFNGSPSDPTFSTGAFNATYEAVGGTRSFAGTISIEPISTTSPVPEPSTLALMATGILGAITTLKQRKFITK
jgi:PEP-CTERM motif